MKKNILAAIVVSVCGSVIAVVSYDLGKLAGKIETSIKMYEMIDGLRNGNKK